MKSIIIISISLLLGIPYGYPQSSGDVQKPVNTPSQNKPSSKTSSYYGSWFYLPAFPLNFTVNTEQEIDIYTIAYKAQFEKTEAQAGIPVLGKDELNFHVTGYDPNIFVTGTRPTISGDHKLTYKIKNGITPDSGNAFLTIIAVLKK